MSLASSSSWRQSGATFLRLGAALVALYLMMGWCASCKNGPTWVTPVGPILALTGALTNFAAMIAALMGGGRGSDLADGFLCLGLIGGFWMLAFAARSHVPVCELCGMFWGLQLVLLAELIFSRRRLARIGMLLPFLGIITVGLPNVNPTLQSELSLLAPRVVLGQGGPLLGQKLVLPVSIPPDGYVVLCTECAPCMFASLEQGVAQLSETGRPVTVLASRTNNTALRVLPKKKIIRIADDIYYSDLRLTKDGAPIFVQIQNSVVVRVGPASEFFKVKNEQ